MVEWIRKWRNVFLLALITTALLQIPYALGYALAPRDQVYLGLVMNAEDSLSYFAKMREGYDGAWLYTIPFTSEEHAPAFVGTFYIGLGQLARLLGLSLAAMWFAARVTADLFLFLVTFWFITEFLREARARWLAYALALFGSGLGWLLFILNQPYWLGEFPVDFKMPEAHLFFTALTFPHVAFGAAMIMVSLLFSQRAVTLTLDPSLLSKEKGTWWYHALIAGGANLALGIAYPFLIYLVALTMGIYFFSRVVRARRIVWREGFRLALTFLIPAPLYLSYIYTLATNSIFRAWDAQSITLSPPLPHYLIAYGVMLILALLPILSRKSSRTVDGRSRGDSLRSLTTDDLLWCWLIAAALLLYAPFNPQRRFVEGIQVPLAILATLGFLQSALPWLRETRAFRWLASRPRYSALRVERFITLLFVIGMSLSNIYLFASVTITAAVQQPYPFFRPRAEVEAVDWLRANANAGAVVLSAYEMGNYIGAFTPQRVVVGHWAETVDYDSKLNEVAQFFDSATNAETRAGVLDHERVSYVWFGAEEKKLGAFDPSRAVSLTRVFANSDVAIYRVNQ